MFAGTNISPEAYYYDYFKTRSKKLIWWILFQFGKSKSVKVKIKKFINQILKTEQTYGIIYFFNMEAKQYKKKI